MTSPILQKTKFQKNTHAAAAHTPFTAQNQPAWWKWGQPCNPTGHTRSGDLYAIIYHWVLLPIDGCLGTGKNEPGVGKYSNYFKSYTHGCQQSCTHTPYATNLYNQRDLRPDLNSHHIHQLGCMSMSGLLRGFIDQKASKSLLTSWTRDWHHGAERDTYTMVCTR